MEKLKSGYDFFNKQESSKKQEEKSFLLSVKNKYKKWKKFTNENFNEIISMFIAGLIIATVLGFFIFMFVSLEKKLTIREKFENVVAISNYVGVATTENSMNFNIDALNRYIQEKQFTNYKGTKIAYYKENNNVEVNFKTDATTCDLVARKIYDAEKEFKLKNLMINNQKIERDMVLSKTDAKNLCGLENNDIVLNFKGMK